jgi:hypothetical protein
MRVITLVSFLMLAGAEAGALAEEPMKEQPVVTVDLGQTVVEPFMGLGIQWDPYEYRPTPEDWKVTLERLDFCRPALFRVMWMAHPYCRGFDADGKPKYVWDEGDAAAKEKFAPLLPILDYCQARGIDAMLGEWGPPRGLKSEDGKAISGPGDARWARIITDFVLYLRQTKGYACIRLYNMMNEPNGGWMWPGGKVDYAAWAAGIRNLRREFDAKGLAALPIVGPDNSGDWNWLDRCAKDLPKEVGAWDMHWYAMDKEVVEGRIEKLLSEKREMLARTGPEVGAKPRFMGEAGIFEGRCNGDQQPRVKTFVYGVLMADYAAQVARAGWMGAVAWDLDDAMHCVNGNHRPVPPDDKTLKIWGFWNTQGHAMGHPEDEKIRPWFYTWSLMTRLFPKGSKIVQAGGVAVPAFRALAGTDAVGKELSVMLVNDADAPRKVTLRVPGAGVRNLTLYHFFDGDRPTDENGYPAPKEKTDADLERGAEIALPSRGVVFLTTRSLKP